ncbi:hypothetical protein BC332_18806 [Capsicum chinense]|nr:hypothetical protein BC332_18806 [Capsicum chinense]
METTIEQTVKKKHITIKVETQGEDDDFLFFKIRRDVPLQNLMFGFCERRNLRYKEVRFIYDGKRVDPKQTANDLEMEDEDCISVFLEQLGGGGVHHSCMW